MLIEADSTTPNKNMKRCIWETLSAQTTLKPGDDVRYSEKGKQV
jgi:hypothetical protein